MTESAEVVAPAEVGGGSQAAQPAELTSVSLLARNATLNLLTEGWIFLVLIIAMPKLVSFLGETLFGLFSLAWVVIGYLAFLDIGVNRAATKFVSEYLAEKDQESASLIVRTALTTNLFLGLIGGLAVVLVSPYLIHSVLKISVNLDNQARLTFYAVALAVPVLLVQGIFRAVLTSFQRFDWINGVNAVTTTAQWIAAVVLAWKGHSVPMVVLATVLARIFATVVYGVILFRLLPNVYSFPIKTFYGLFKLLRFGSWVSVSQVVSPILVYLDRALIASFVSLGAVTFYTIPYEVMTRLRIIPSSLVATLYPAFSERGLGGQRGDLRSLYEGSVRYLLLLLLPSILFLFVLGPDLLRLWMGVTFAEQTSTSMRILAFGALANGIAYVPYNMLQAVGRPDLTGKFHLVELPPYFILCMLLIPRWGIQGAAWASTFRFVLDSGLLFWAAARYGGCSLRFFLTRPLPRILAIASMLALTFILIRLTGRTATIRLCLAVPSLAAYLVAVWLLVVERQERPRIEDALRMLRNYNVPGISQQ